MAQGLKVGEKVTVNRVIDFGGRSKERGQGLDQINPGDVGKIVGPSVGRSFSVEFKGIRTVISSQRLERVSRKGRRAGSAGSKVSSLSGGTKSTLGDSAGAGNEQKVVHDLSRLIATLANKMLLQGQVRIEDGASIVIPLAELPGEVQQRIQALVDAKLALETASEESEPAVRRGEGS